MESIQGIDLNVISNSLPQLVFGEIPQKDWEEMMRGYEDWLEERDDEDNR